jgi:hypothetical protein
MPQAARPLGPEPTNDYLHRIEQKPLGGQAVAAGVEAEVLHNAGKTRQRIFGDFAILLASTEGLKTQQGRGCRGIPCGRGRILQRLASRR